MWLYLYINIIGFKLVLVMFQGVSFLRNCGAVLVGEFNRII